MHNRSRLLMGTTALLYLGPLLAGLGGFGWAVVPVFVAIFLLWTRILRPTTWPASRAEWRQPDLLLRLVLQSAVQVLLVVVCFGIGRGLGGVLGALPPFPVLLPIAVSFLAVPLSRLFWDPVKAEAMDRFLDTAIAGINAAAAGQTPPDRSDARALTAQLLAPLQALPDDASAADIETHLRAIGAHACPEDIDHVLQTAGRAGTAGKAALRALILYATDLRNTDRLAGQGAQTRAFLLIAAQDDLALLFARRSTAQLTDDPAARDDSPSPETLREAAARLGPQAAAALMTLADLTEACAPSGDA